MTYLKVHYSVNDTTGSSCGRGRVTNTDVSRVTCQTCLSKPEVVLAKAEAAVRAREAFEAQVPRSFNEPWQPGIPMVCKGCGGFLFRHRGRSCMGHYDDWECADCGGTESRLTETGMSF